MRIQTKTVEIRFEKPLSLDFIKNELEKMNLNPIRWAITSVKENMATISVSFLS